MVIIQIHFRHYVKARCYNAHFQIQYLNRIFRHDSNDAHAEDIVAMLHERDRCDVILVRARNKHSRRFT